MSQCDNEILINIILKEQEFISVQLHFLLGKMKSQNALSHSQRITKSWRTSASSPCSLRFNISL
jgi:hypothetical protein